MRLRDMWEVLSEVVDNLQINTQATNTNGKLLITNFNEFYDAISKIESFDFITDDIDILSTKFSSILYDKSRHVIVADSEISELRGLVAQIKLKVITVIAAINEALPPQSPNTVSIKLPHYTDLGKIQGFVRTFDTIFNQTLGDKYQGPVQFQNFDTGSSWIEVVIHSEEALIYFCAFVRHTWNFVRDGYMDYLSWKHRTEVLNVDLETRKTILAAIEDDMKTKAALNAKALTDEFDVSTETQEYHAKLVHSMRDLGELLLQGTEVRTAIEAPKEAKEAVPDPKDMQALVGQALKLLAAPNSSDEDGESQN